jgi:hypothetical protein
MKIHNIVVTISAVSIGIIDATSNRLRMHRLTNDNSRKYVRGGSTIEFGRSILNPHEAQAV